MKQRTNLPAYKVANVSELVPYARNARTHSAAQVDKIAASINEYGFTNPILTDGALGIIAGHGRVLAALQLGMREVPTVELSHLSDSQKRAYVLADNRLALDAGWDLEILKIELANLEGDGFDLALTGFEPLELSGLLDAAPVMDQGSAGAGAGSLAAKFGLPPFTVLNAREGWWQERKREWLALGIQSEIGRGGGEKLTMSDTIQALKPNADKALANSHARTPRPNATPGGSPLPAADYRTGKRGDGRGRVIA